MPSIEGHEDLFDLLHGASGHVLADLPDNPVLDVRTIMLAQLPQCLGGSHNDHVGKIAGEHRPAQHLGRVGREARLLHVVRVRRREGAASRIGSEGASGRIGDDVTGPLAAVLQRAEDGEAQRFGIPLVPQEQALASVGHEDDAVAGYANSISPMSAGVG